MADKMRAMVKAKAAPGLEMQRVDIPNIGPRDVLVKVRAASICGTDLHMSNLSMGLFSAIVHLRADYKTQQVHFIASLQELG